VGFGSSAQTRSDYETELTGLWSVDVGGRLIGNLTLHGRLAHNISDDGEVEGSATLLMPALSYYFMPVNIYLTGGAGFGEVTRVLIETDHSSTTTGIALTLDVGKEWWVSANWGLGIAGRICHIRSGQDADIEYYSGGLLFSATFQ